MKKYVRVISGITIFVLLVLIGLNLWSRHKSNETYQELEKKVTKPITESKKKYSGEGTEDEYWYNQYGIEVDFEQLKQLNSDIVAWIQFDQLDISYPILLGETNEEYLRTNYLHQNVTAGSIFMDSENRGDLKEYHPIIYGHNMRDGSMFGQLKNYKEESFYKGNEYFTIYTEEYVFRYVIFSCHDTDAYGSVYTVGFLPDAQYEDFLRRLKKASWYDTGIDVTKEDQIVTLSTCTTNAENRFVVHGKLIEVLRNE